MQPTDVTAAAAWKLEFAPTTYETDANSEIGQIQAELATIKEQLGIDAAATNDFKCHGDEQRECDSLFQTLVKVDSSVETSATMALLGFVFGLLTFLLVLVMFIMTFAMKKKNNSVAMVTKG